MKIVSIRRSTGSNDNYRPDIDGLRAIAVLGVLLFHLGAPFARGGFVGVDVFFVISGYLITRLIWNQLQDKSFSFTHFYIRRARRLLPALFFSLSLSTVFATLLLPPQALTHFFRALFASTISLSNFYFWDNANYFDIDAKSNPLLHTWSLSVEEQFYMFWPAILVFIFTRKTRYTAPIAVIVLGFASYFISSYFSDGIHISVFGFEKEAEGMPTLFYLTPFRIFEFAIGAILIWWKKPTNNTYKLVENMLAPVGIVIICWSIASYNKDMIFPWYNALLPCIGAAFVIAGNNSYYGSAILRNRWIVYIGIISYSLYLLHWPLIVYFKSLSALPLSSADMLLLCTASIVAAALTHKYIEQPFRNYGVKIEYRLRANRKFLTIGGVSALALLTISFNAARSGGELWRFSPEVAKQLQLEENQFEAYNTINSKNMEGDFTSQEQHKLLVIGDSQASDLINILVAAKLHQRTQIRYLKIDAKCQPMIGIKYNEFANHIPEALRSKCRQELAKSEKDTRIATSDTVIIAANWRMWSADLMPRVISYLKNQGATHILVVGKKAQIMGGIDAILNLSTSTQFSVPDKQRLKMNKNTRLINVQLAEQAKSYEFLDLTTLFCTKRDGCRYLTPSGKVIFWDRMHLTPEGARYLAARLIERTDIDEW